MKKLIALFAILLATGATLLEPNAEAQCPPDPLMSRWAAYKWTLVDGNSTRFGHVVVRAPNADSIEGLDHVEDTETWYYGGSTGSGGTPYFELEVLMFSDPKDLEPFTSLVEEIADNETKMGTMGMEPLWESDPNLGTSPQIFTLTDVVGGPASSYSSLYEHVSIQLPDPTKMPTIYSDDDSLYSVVGGNSSYVPTAEGMTLTFSVASSNGAGYPDSDWFWVGREL